jgi:hypothetical protein
MLASTCEPKLASAKLPRQPRTIGEHIDGLDFQMETPALHLIPSQTKERKEMLMGALANTTMFFFRGLSTIIMIVSVFWACYLIAQGRPTSLAAARPIFILLFVGCGTSILRFKMRGDRYGGH